MRKLSVALVVLLLTLPSYALDWKSLHEKADQFTLDELPAFVKDDPGSPDTLYMQALIYLNYHRVEEARAAFQRILHSDPDSVEAKWGLAEILRRDKKTDESEAMLNEVIEDDPAFWPAYITLAYLRYTQTDFDAAVKLALKVRRQGKERVDLSNYTRSYLIFAGAKGMIASNGGPLSKLLNGTQVLPNLKKAEKLQPDSAAVLFGLGSFYFLAPSIAGGNINKAVDYLERTIEADPLFTDGYVRLAQVYKSKGDLVKYRFYLDKAVAIDPQNELLRDEQGGVCKFNCVTVEE